MPISVPQIVAFSRLRLSPLDRLAPRVTYSYRGNERTNIAFTVWNVLKLVSWSPAFGGTAGDARNPLHTGGYSPGGWPRSSR